MNAASCSQPDVTAAISSAPLGAVVQVPAGSCSWSGLSLAKAIHLRGAGPTATQIAISNCTVTKQSSGVVRMSGFAFTRSGGGNAAKGIEVGGSWSNAEPFVFEHNKVTVSNSGFFHISVAGGVLISANEFTGDWDDSFIQAKDQADSSGSWSSPDTLGVRDVGGRRNLYVEGNSFTGGTNQGIDCDDASRCVYRNNTLLYSSFNSHGLDTSNVGLRHFEVYSNQFRHLGGSTQLANQNWAIWIRGGTGVIFNNNIDNLAGSTWGDKDELHFSIRGAEDARPQGACANVTYPVPRQLGQNTTGSQPFTDPIYLWANMGATTIAAGWDWGNPCGFNWSTFFQMGRDLIVGTPKPGYTPLAYPHPLASP